MFVSHYSTPPRPRISPREANTTVALLFKNLIDFTVFSEYVPLVSNGPTL